MPTSIWERFFKPLSNEAKPVPEPGDLTEDELTIFTKCVEDWLPAEKVLTKRLIAEVRRHRKEQPESPRKHIHHFSGVTYHPLRCVECGKDATPIEEAHFRFMEAEQRRAH